MTLVWARKTLDPKRPDSCPELDHIAAREGAGRG